MLQSYLKIALRNLYKRKGNAFINIAGLAIGLASCLFIFLYVYDELSYDRFHKHAGRIYRIAVDIQSPNAPPEYFATSSGPLGKTLRVEFPEVEDVTRMYEWRSAIVKHGNEYFTDDNFLYTEPSFFNVFSFPLVKGNPATALKQPFTLVMTEEMERKYFGSENALGQSITINDTLQFTVTGVVADVPKNSHFSFDFLISYATLDNLQPGHDAADKWLWLNTYNYVLLKDGVSAAYFDKKIAGLMMRYYGKELEKLGYQAKLVLQPITDIHLHSTRMGELAPNSHIKYIYIFSTIALFIMLIACINFMNMATAQSIERAKEVGMRKVLGSSRMLLVWQFLTESFLMCLFAFVIAIGLLEVALPFLKDLVGKDIQRTALLNPWSMFGFIVIIIIIGLLSGTYPAFLLSNFAPIEVLKGAFRSTPQGVRLRQGLVIFQFAIAVVLIVSTLVVFNQLQYMYTQDMGFDKEQVLVVDARGVPRIPVIRQYETIKHELGQIPSVLKVSASNTVPGRGTWYQIARPEGVPENQSPQMHVVSADHDFLETFGVKLVAGRNFSQAFETDRQEALLINETAVKSFGWGMPESALGKHIRVSGRNGIVVGIMQDYHHYSLKQQIEPLAVLIAPEAFSFFSLRIATADVASTLSKLKQTWNTTFPGYILKYFFLDEDYDQQYRAEQQLGRIFGTFSLLAILIACLGLLGLAAFTAVQRTKEIGVRKVLGASVSQIVLLMSKDFTKLVAAAFVVAVPFAYFIMNKWLQNFAYRADIGWWIFALAGGLALVIALLTVSAQAIRAALANPVEALRYE